MQMTESEIVASYKRNRNKNQIDVLAQLNACGKENITAAADIVDIAIDSSRRNGAAGNAALAASNIEIAAVNGAAAGDAAAGNFGLAGGHIEASAVIGLTAANRAAMEIEAAGAHIHSAALFHLAANDLTAVEMVGSRCGVHKDRAAVAGGVYRRAVDLTAVEIQSALLYIHKLLTACRSRHDGAGFAAIGDVQRAALVGDKLTATNGDHIAIKAKVQGVFAGAILPT